jgi:hypothetical protein
VICSTPAQGVSFAPLVHEVAFAVEDEDGHVAAIEDEDVVLGIDGDGGGFAQPDAVGDTGPEVHGLVGGERGDGGGHDGVLRAAMLPSGAHRGKRRADGLPGRR